MKARKRKPMSKKLKNNLTAYGFMTPWFIGFTVFTLFPIIFMFAVSLTNRKLTGLSQYIGFTNYINIFKNQNFWNSFRVTILYTIVVMIVTSAWALLMAMLLNHKNRLNGIFQFCYFLPSVIPSVALSYAFRSIFGRDAGLLNFVLSNVSSKNVLINWLYDPAFVYQTVFFITLFTYSTGQMMLIYRSGLNEVPVQLYEASDIDGASSRQKFFNITLPQISPVLLFNTITGSVSALNGSFALLYPLTGEEGNPNKMTQVLSLLIYNESFSNQRVGYGSALSVILFLIACAFGLIIFTLSKKLVYYEN